MKKLLYFSTALLILLAALQTTATADPGDFCRGDRGGQGSFMRGGGNCEGHGAFGMRGGRGDRGGRGAGMGIQMILNHGEEISLTDKQKTELNRLHENFQMERIDKKAELEKAQVKLRTLQMADNPLEPDVLTAIDKVGGLKTGMRKMQYTHRKAIEKVLTVEQRDKLKELFKQGMGKRFGNGPGDGPGQGNGKGKGIGRR